MSQHADVELSTDDWWTADESTQRVMWFPDFLRLATDQSVAVTGMTGYSRDVTESSQGGGERASELEMVFHRHRILLSVVSQQVEIGEAFPFESKTLTPVRGNVDGPQSMPRAFSTDAASSAVRIRRCLGTPCCVTPFGAPQRWKDRNPRCRMRRPIR